MIEGLRAVLGIRVSGSERWVGADGWVLLAVAGGFGGAEARGLEAEVRVFGGGTWGRVTGVVEVSFGWSACAEGLPGGSPKDEVVRRNDEGSGQQPQRL